MESQEDQTKHIGRLEDELKIAERRIAELKTEGDEVRDLAARMHEHVEDADAVIQSWIEGFRMQLNDAGEWEWCDELVEMYDGLMVKYSDLLKRWNRFVPNYNAIVAPKDVGRPLGATNAQSAQVRKLHRGRMSLRTIADETSLSLQTVRTILGRDAETDRTSIKRLERIDPDRAEVAAWKARKRTRDALPRRIGETLKEGADLIKAAKGLGVK